MISHNKAGIVFFSLCAVLFMCGCAQRPTVLVTGYWPPTNEMLIPLSNDAALNPAGWQGSNWRRLGYDVYACFPTFPNGTNVNPAGEGCFQVDYQATWADFRRMTGQLKPVAILCYGRGAGPWEIECQAVYPDRWHKDYQPPFQPTNFSGCGRSYETGQVIKLTLPTTAIEAALSEAMPQLGVWVDRDGDPGNFLCNYLALLAADYQECEPNCRAVGFIHVGPMVDAATAQRAHETTLETLLTEISR